MNSNPLGPTDHELYVDHMESKAKGRITEAALLIANVVEFLKEEEAPPPHWIHHDKWSIAINRSKGDIIVTWVTNTPVKIPFGSMAIWNDSTDQLCGVFSTNEGYLNNADEFINDMKELLEKEVV